MNPAQVLRAAQLRPTSRAVALPIVTSLRTPGPARDAHPSLRLDRGPVRTSPGASFQRTWTTPIRLRRKADSRAQPGPVPPRAPSRTQSPSPQLGSSLNLARLGSRLSNQMMLRVVFPWLFRAVSRPRTALPEVQLVPAGRCQGKGLWGYGACSLSRDQRLELEGIKHNRCVPRDCGIVYRGVIESEGRGRWRCGGLSRSLGARPTPLR